jgi:hypothetical protein
MTAASVRSNDGHHANFPATISPRGNTSRWTMTTPDSAAAVQAVREIFEAIDSGDVDALCRQVTEDIRFQFGNAEVITSRSAFEAASIAFLKSIAAIRHELLDLWEADDEQSSR